MNLNSLIDSLETLQAAHDCLPKCSDEMNEEDCARVCAALDRFILFDFDDLLKYLRELKCSEE